MAIPECATKTAPNKSYFNPDTTLQFSLLPSMLDATIMMVDDEPIIAEVVQTFLEEAGYRHFITSHDPSSAADTIRSAVPDVLLLDLNMPGVSGYEILESIRRDQALCHLPVIILTSAADPATKLRALELGATDFLAKPVDRSELTLRLRNTLAFKSYQDRLAYYDALTGLPNRRLFLRQLQKAIDLTVNERRLLALLHVDLDRFRRVNDSLGHTVGDNLLKAVAVRLVDCVTPDKIAVMTQRHAHTAIVSRVGSDEFTVLLSHIDGPDDAARAARRLVESFAEPVVIDGQEIFVTPSIGIAIFPNDARNGESLIRVAEGAMLPAKRRGGNMYAFHSSDTHERSYRRLTLEGHLRRAIARNELTVHFQPKVDIATSKIVAAEALARWEHPQLGTVMPSQFIPIAEETGLITAIGEWLLHHACGQAMTWRSAGLPQIAIAINVSAVQFRHRNILRSIDKAKELTGFPIERLIVELTESVLLRDAQTSGLVIKAIKDRGVQLSLDDFGTGYSSLAYLKNFPLDELKMDRSFVKALPEDSGSRAIVGAVTALAHGLKLRVTAEGVENAAQLEYLRRHGCDQYQGFLYSRPLPAEEFAALLRRPGADCEPEAPPDVSN